MKIEVLFPELCNLFGDVSNIKYLQKCLPDAEFINTSIEDVPYFVDNNVNLIYLGPMTEKMQEKVIKKLLAYKERIQELINKDVVFLFTGNAMQVLESYIENEDGSRIQGLGIINLYSKRDMFNRYNCLSIGEFEDIEIVGFKSQFTMEYGDNKENYFMKVTKGIGINKESNFEGIHIRNFFGTSLLGPILILNPLFTKKILNLMGVNEPKLAFEEECMKAYELRLEEFKRL